VNNIPIFVLQDYGLDETSLVIESYGTGLINHTWKVSSCGQEFILQKVNHMVFSEPLNIAHNCKQIETYLKRFHPDYTFVSPLPSLNGEEMICKDAETYFRLFPFVKGSHSKDVAETPEQAYEASRQFGRFTKILSGLDLNQLKITLPSFHDLNLRYRQFLNALEAGNKERINQSKELIDWLVSNSSIVEQYKAIVTNTDFKLRVTHHDTKISNVLFDASGKGICVIDIDTVMPGYFFSDVGDMMRTYLSPANEEEIDFSKIGVREEFYHAIKEGYYAEMKEELTETEEQHFFYAGKFMIYMQALRFLTDHLNNDTYYGARYAGQNKVRAQNQVTLLQCLLDKEHTLK
jgi:Ser/Thr protein kinase RdoA (MazF antagonist)